MKILESTHGDDTFAGLVANHTYLNHIDLPHIISLFLAQQPEAKVMTGPFRTTLSFMFLEYLLPNDIGRGFADTMIRWLYSFLPLPALKLFVKPSTIKIVLDLRVLAFVWLKIFTISPFDVLGNLKYNQV